MLHIFLNIFFVIRIFGNADQGTLSLSDNVFDLSTDLEDPFASARRLATTELSPIQQTLPVMPNFNIFFDPPNGTASPHAMGIYVYSNLEGFRIYYNLFGEAPTLNSSYATASKPYITVDTPFQGGRNRTIILIGQLLTQWHP